MTTDLTKLTEDELIEEIRERMRVYAEHMTRNYIKRPVRMVGNTLTYDNRLY